MEIQLFRFKVKVTRPWLAHRQ